MMLEIRAGIDRVDPRFLGRLAELDLPAFGHVVEDGFTAGLRRVAGGARLVVGQVVTVKLVDTDSRMVHYSTALVEPNDFVVIEPAPEHLHACVGGAIAGAYAAAGVVGVAVGGTCTDVVELRESGLAVHCTELSPFTTRNNDAPIHGAINVPVTVGGVSVEPGMIALADENGLLFTTPDVLSAAIGRVTEMLEWEREITPRITNGEKLADHIISADDLAILNTLSRRTTHRS